MLIPAVTGDFGAMPGHVPTVAQLRPGVVTVHKELDKQVEKYFVAGGFAFVHADSSADICAVEAVKISDLDADAVRAGLQVGARPRRERGWDGAGPGLWFERHPGRGERRRSGAQGGLRGAERCGMRAGGQWGAHVAVPPQAVADRAPPRSRPHPRPLCQDYTGKLAALQGKGDDYEIAAAQVRAGAGGCQDKAARRVARVARVRAHMPARDAAALSWRQGRWPDSYAMPALVQVGVEVYSALNSAIGA